jgi:hypothetical protein
MDDDDYFKEEKGNADLGSILERYGYGFYFLGLRVE